MRDLEKYYEITSVYFCLFQSIMGADHGLGLFMAIVFLSGEMAGVSLFPENDLGFNSALAFYLKSAKSFSHDIFC